ncbi:MAG: ethylbenzene dehydrogenase-related protein [Desulfobacteraceae bacterium]
MKKMTLVMLVALLGVFAVLQDPGAQSESKGDLLLTCQKVKTAPENAGSSVWNQAREAKIVLTGNGSVEGKVIEIKTKSVYTKDNIFFRFEWPDKNKSMNKNRWRFSGGQWTKIKGDEDRLGLVFEINRIDKFATKGCAVLCHNESKKQEEWYYAVEKPREKAEMWHWKAVRSNPVGYTEDGYVTTNPTKKPEEGRKRDAGSDTKAKSNRTNDKSKPAFMQDPSKPASIQDSLLVSQAVEIKDYSIFKEGDEIPGYMLFTDWKGSFADVRTQGTWQDGGWTVMMSRKLDTGYDDDLQFNTRKRYPFGLAVFDNAHEHNSYNSEPLKLEFK